MNIITTIQLGADEYAADLAGNSTELAERIMKAVGGDEAKDTCSVQIQDMGLSGVTSVTVAAYTAIPPPPPPPLLPPPPPATPPPPPEPPSE